MEQTPRDKVAMAFAVLCAFVVIVLLISYQVHK
jgi:hypothetical protein